MKALLLIGFVRSVKILYDMFEICLNLLEFASVGKNSVDICIRLGAPSALTH